MQTFMQNILSKKTLLVGAFAVLAVIFVVLSIPAPAHATDVYFTGEPSCYDCGGYGGGYYDNGYYGGYSGDGYFDYSGYDTCYDCYGGGYYDDYCYDCGGYGGDYGGDLWYDLGYGLGSSIFNNNDNNNTNVNNNNVVVNVPSYNPQCPSGTTGTYPDCVWPNPTCPTGTTGTYPNCNYTIPCPSGSIGTYPNCVWPNPQCPSGSTGTYPNCYQVQNPPTCSMYINNYSNGNNSATLVWNSNNATSGYINQIGSVGSNGSQQVYATNTTTYNGTFTGPGGTVNCTATFYVNPNQNTTCDLRASSTNINRGQSLVLSWSAPNSYNGFITQIGSVSSIGSQTVFPQSDITYTATFIGSNGQQSNCSVFVRVNAGQVAGVFLSQVPYTGFEAGPVLTALFWAAVALLAALIAYYIAGRGTLQYVMEHVAGSLALPTAADIHVNNPHASIEEDSRDTAYVASATASVLPVFASVTREPVAHSEEKTGLPSIVDVIESRAHAAGVLMSPEAAHQAAALSNDRAQTLQMFGDILNEAVRTLPREDGWVMLTSDRFTSIAAEKGIALTTPVEEKATEKVEVDPATPTLEKLDTLAATEFVGAIISGNRDAALGIVRSLETDHVNPESLVTGTIAVLRTQGRTDLADAFAHALDASYSNKYTGLKLALGQAFEIVG